MELGSFVIGHDASPTLMLSGIICPVRQPYEDRWMTDDLVDRALVNIPGWLLPQAAFFQGLATWGPMVYVVISVVKTTAKLSAWQMQHNLWVHNETRNVCLWPLVQIPDLSCLTSCGCIIYGIAPRYTLDLHAVATVVKQIRNRRHTKKGHKLTGAYRNYEWSFTVPFHDILSTCML